MLKCAIVWEDDRLKMYVRKNGKLRLRWHVSLTEHDTINDIIAKIRVLSKKGRFHIMVRDVSKDDRQRIYNDAVDKFKKQFKDLDEDDDDGGASLNDEVRGGGEGGGSPIFSPAELAEIGINPSPAPAPVPANTISTHDVLLSGTVGYPIGTIELYSNISLSNTGNRDEAIFTGSIPSGLTMVPKGGIINGRPAAEDHGTYPIVVSALNYPSATLNISANIVP